MTERGIKDALLSRLFGLPIIPVPPIDTGLKIYEPTAGVTYLEARFLQVAHVRPGVANDATRTRPGIFQVTVCAPMTSDPRDADDIVEVVLSHFARGTKASHDGISVTIGSATGANGEPTPNTPLIDGAWRRHPVSIPYFVFG